MILADEPVASLDPVLAHSILQYLEMLNQEDKITPVLPVHGMAYLIDYFDKHGFAKRYVLAKANIFLNLLHPFLTRQRHDFAFIHTDNGHLA